MFFSDWRALLRRWYIVLAGLLVTVGLGVAATVLAPPSYEIKASILLVPPKVAVGTGGNPYLSLGGLEGATDVLSRAMADGGVHQQLVDAGASPDFIVATDPTTAGPVVLVTVDAPSIAAAEKTLKLVTAEMPEAIKKLQDDAAVPLSSRITLQQISQDRVPLIVRKAQIRAVMLGVAVGIAFTLFGVGFLDGYSRRKAESRQRPSQSVAPGAGFPPHPGPGPALFPGEDHRPFPSHADPFPVPPDQGRRPDAPPRPMPAPGPPVRTPDRAQANSSTGYGPRPHQGQPAQGQPAQGQPVQGRPGQGQPGQLSQLSQLDWMSQPGRADQAGPADDDRPQATGGSPLSAHRRETPRRGPSW